MLVCIFLVFCLVGDAEIGWLGFAARTDAEKKAQKKAKKAAAKSQEDKKGMRLIGHPARSIASFGKGLSFNLSL
jgi:hypothetical protein